MRIAALQEEKRNWLWSSTWRFTVELDQTSNFTIKSYDARQKKILTFYSTRKKI